MVVVVVVEVIVVVVVVVEVVADGVVVVVVVVGVPTTTLVEVPSDPVVPGDANVRTALLVDKSVIVPLFKSSEVVAL